MSLQPTHNPETSDRRMSANIIEFPKPTQRAMVFCAACYWCGTDEADKPLTHDHIAEHVPPGAEMPHGICPSCDRSTYTTKPDVADILRNPAFEAALAIVKDLSKTIGALKDHHGLPDKARAIINASENRLALAFILIRLPEDQDDDI